MVKRIIIFYIFILFSGFAFSQQKALVGDNKVNVRNSPTTKNSKILYQLNAGDEIIVYSSIGDKSISNSAVNYWYKISQDKEEWVNAEFVYTFPCDFVEMIADCTDIDRFDRIVFRDYKKEDGILYFLIDYVNNYYRSYGGESLKRWEKASEYNWIGNKSKNAKSFIESFTDSYTKDFLSKKINSFIKEKDKYGDIYYKLIEDSDEIIYSDRLGGGEFYLFEINISTIGKVYPYGIRIGMDIDEFIEKMGGYEIIKQEDGYLFYTRESI